MKTALLSVLTLAVCTIDSSSLKSYRIFGGQNAKEGQFPYQLSLQGPHLENLNPNQHYCGASILSHNWIVTAGHCCLDNVTATRIIAGIINAAGEDSEYKQERSIAEVYVHEDFIGGANPHDICLIKINKPWVYNDRVQPIALPVQDLNIIGEVVASGWGESAPDYFPDMLQWQKSEMPDEETCVNLCDKIEANPYDSLANVCTANPEADHGVCHGDSGSPLVLDKQLVGIGSWVFGPCGRKGAPSVFTRVSHYVAWIKQHVTEL
ncbi:trypsin-1 [Diabrotica virgifera virgifera]|uniref:Trypsin-1-like n=1 Tax=Diabrotica virgifera virgifera TaxID=50390 RepID=A0A6P7F8Z8_DIAVI|nr:trypsin-1 [Diabrotica virgifera virgifera]